MGLKRVTAREAANTRLKKVLTRDVVLEVIRRAEVLDPLKEKRAAAILSRRRRKTTHADAVGPATQMLRGQLGHPSRAASMGRRGLHAERSALSMAS